MSFPEVWSIDGKHGPKGILMDFCELRLRKIISGTETLWKLPLISPRWKVISSSSVHCTSLQAGFCFLPHATSLSSPGKTYICIYDLIRGHTLSTFQFTYNICTYNVPLAIVAPQEFTSCVSYCSLFFQLLFSFQRLTFRHKSISHGTCFLHPLIQKLKCERVKSPF